jgi:hypothetical protein
MHRLNNNEYSVDGLRDVEVTRALAHHNTGRNVRNNHFFFNH